MASPAFAKPAVAQPRYALTMGVVLMAEENREQYETHVKEQYRQYKPIAEHEIFFTHERADAMWRMRRARRMEAKRRLPTSSWPSPATSPASSACTTAPTTNSGASTLSDTSTGVVYNIHASYHHQPFETDWQPKPPEKQNEPTARQLANIQFLMNEFRRPKR